MTSSLSDKALLNVSVVPLTDQLDEADLTPLTNTEK
jgi:hypothetical protein